MNPLHGMMNSNRLMQQFNQFRQSFQGDPKQKVQELLDSGRMSQAQFNQFQQMANQLRNMFK